MTQKKVAAIHDISCCGRCSLTVVLPILSAAGIETSVIPTAVLSTHTGGFTGYTRRDLTEDLAPIAAHWKSLDVSFDALYSGYLASPEQIGVVGDIFTEFKEKETLIMVDPVMADNGRLYEGFTPQMAAGMAELCKKADLVVPNMTEAALLLGEEFRDGPYDRAGVERLMQKLARLGPRYVVLTGVWFSPELLGAACYDAETGATSYAFSPRIAGSWHGTGDVFGSALLASLLCGFSMKDGLQIAVDYVCGSIRAAKSAGTDPRRGVCFETQLPLLMEALGLLNTQPTICR